MKLNLTRTDARKYYWRSEKPRAATQIQQLHARSNQEHGTAPDLYRTSRNRKGIPASSS